MSTGSETLPGPHLVLGMPRAERRRANGFLISSFACAFITGTLLLYSSALFHWFIIPIFLCGLVIGRDAVDWVRGRLDAFDPVGLVGLLGVHLFFLAPLLHVAWDYWMRYVVPPPDWRGWLGGMAILNLLGLMVYRGFASGKAKSATCAPSVTAWRLHGKRCFVILVTTLLIAGGLQVWSYARFGGVLDYIASYAAREDAFEGMGWIFMVSESFPIVAMIAFATVARPRPILRTWPVLLLALAAFFVVQMLFGGLRGSRSNTAWAMFWAVGIIHLVVRSVPRRLIYAGLGLLVVFMYLYGFYKAAGLEAMSALEGSEARADLEQRTGRTLDGVILGDLARSDVHAYLLYKLWPVPDDYSYAWGRTYSGAAALLIPRSVWPERPPTKVMEGTEALYGTGSYVPGVFQSSRVYGLAGEAMLNFGPFAVPFAFIALAAVVRRLRRWRAGLAPGDARLMLYPLLVNLSVVMLSSDSDNLLFVTIKNGTVPFLVVWFGSSRVSREEGLQHPFASTSHSYPEGARWLVQSTRHRVVKAGRGVVRPIRSRDAYATDGPRGDGAV